MAATGLAALYSEISRPDAGGSDPDFVFSARPIPGHGRHRLAMSANGDACLLVAHSFTLGGRTPAPRAFEHLSVRHSVLCTMFRDEGTADTGIFTLVTCRDADEELERYFLRSLETLLAAVPPDPTAGEVVLAISQLVELFRALSEPPRKTIQGLWAELLLIARASEPTRLIDAWHATPNDLYDFSAQDQRLEVKSAQGRQRVHHFSLAQLTPPPGAAVVIASVLMDRAAGGASVQDLQDEILGRLAGDPDRAMRIFTVVADLLGASWRFAATYRFDYEHAIASCAFYDVSLVPCVHADLPSEVRDVHFKSDLDDIASLVASDMAYRGGLFQAAHPVGHPPAAGGVRTLTTRTRTRDVK